MSAVTLSLRLTNLPKKSSKSSKQKCPEKLPNIEEIIDPTCQAIIEGTSLESQIIAIRQVYSASSENHYRISRVLVRWFFLLNSGSCLKPIFASELQKQESDKNIESHMFEFLTESIRKFQNSDDVQTPNLFSLLLRCFDNCRPAKEALKRIKNDLWPIYKRELSADVKQFESADVTSMVRSLLLLQSIDKEEKTGLLPESVNFLGLKNLCSDSKSQMALFVVTELRAIEKEGYVEKVSNSLVDKNSDLRSNLDSLSCLHLVNGFVANLNDEDILRSSSSILLKVYNLLEDVSSGNRDLSTMLVHSAGVLQISIKISSLICSGRNEPFFPSLVELSRRIEAFTWGYLLSFVPKIRYNARNTLASIIKIYKHSSPDGLAELLAKTLKLSWKDKTKYVVLTAMANVLEANVDLILNTCDSLPDCLRSNVEDPSVETLCAELYETLMEGSYKIKQEDVWIQTWIDSLTNLDYSISLPVLEKWIRSAVRLSKRVTAKILQDTQGQSPSEQQLLLALLVIKIDKITGVSTSDEIKKLSSATLFKALSHYNDQLRLQAFGVIVTSRSSKEILTQEELTLLRDSIPYSMVLNSSADRQELVTLMKKLFFRMSERLLPSKSNVRDVSSLEETKSNYKQFLVWLGEFLFSSFFESASSSRRCVALESLSLLFSIFGPLEELSSLSNASVLIDCLGDSYEKNKITALSILELFPVEATTRASGQDSKLIWEKVLQLCCSFKPSDSITVGYLAKFFCTAPGLAEELGCEGSDHRGAVCVKVIEGLKELLKKQMSVAESDLLVSAERSPMYGVFFCVRSVLQVAASKKSRWCRIDANMNNTVGELIQMSYKISDIVAIVLNSDSPEGHLPMDFFEHCSDRNVTSQMLLLCAWRTSKEISLLLGDLCSFQLVTDSRLGFNLSDQQVSEMSSFFMKLLAEIKHRGAFEQAYFGFCHLCNFLWRRNSHQPREMLVETMSALKGETKNKFCSTRRSAGVPFLIQGIVSTEPEPSFPSLLLSTMRELTDLCKSAKPDVRVHACNILRALYRDSRLGEAVEPYISDGVKVAIDGFKASSWSERNSATLLFSALITRIFGVKRTKDELSKKNSITVKVFFIRFPDLHSYLLNELKHVASIIQSGAGAISPEESAIFPVLLILAKLQSSHVTEETDQFKISDFFPYLNSCSGSAVWKVRELSSKCLVSFLDSPVSTLNWLKFLAKQLSETKSNNLIHGTLLQIYGIACSKYVDDCQDISSYFGCELDSVLHQFYNRDDGCCATETVLTKIVSKLKEKSILSSVDVILFANNLGFTMDIDKIETKTPLSSHLDREKMEFVCCDLLLEGKLTPGCFNYIIEHGGRNVRIAAIRSIALSGKTIVDEPLVQGLMCMLNFEQDPEILKWIVKLALKLFPLAPVPKEDVFNKMSVYDYFHVNDELSSAVIEFSGLLAHHLGKNAATEDIFKSWVFVLLHEKGKDQDASPEISTAVAKAIGYNINLLKQTHSNDITSLLLWDLVLTLSQNDDEKVRKMSFDLFVRISDTQESFPASVLPSKILAKVFDLFPCPESVLMALCFASPQTQNRQPDNQWTETGIEPAFEKNELSIWREDRLLQTQVQEAVKNWTETLGPDQKSNLLFKNLDPVAVEIFSPEHKCRKSNYRNLKWYLQKNDAFACLFD